MKTILQSALLLFGTICFAQNVLELNPSNFPITTPCGFTKFNNKLLYVGTNTTYGREMWQTDGSAASNQLLKDIGNQYSLPSVNGFIDQTSQAIYRKTYVFNGKVYFTANDQYAQNNFRAYTSDGTTAGTVRFDPTTSKITTMRYFKEFNGLLYFAGYSNTTGLEIWSTDGTLAGTNLLKDINPNAASSITIDPAFTVVNNKMYFKADDGVHGIELWSTDGTTAGTSMVLDLNTGATDSSSIGAFLQNSNILDEYFKVVGNQFYFKAYQANDNNPSTDLYVSDGTAAGTHRISYTIPGNPNFYYDAQGLTVLNNELYFFGKKTIINSGGGFGLEYGIFKTDGTTAGTILVKSFGSQSGYFGDNGWSDNETTPNSMRIVGNNAYFLSNLQLWKTDGTSAGTIQITTNPTAYFDYQNRMVSQEFNGKLFYVQNAGPVSVQGIYSVDANAAILFEGKNVPQNNNSSTASTLNMTSLPTELTAYGNSLYFSAGYSGTTPSLWRLRNPSLSSTSFESKKLQLNLYPNPATETLNISLNYDVDNASAQIISLTGQIILQKNLINGIDFSFNVSDLSNGIYFLKVTGGSGNFVKKFIKN